MLRRNFLHRSACAALGTLLLPAAGFVRATSAEDTAEQKAVAFLRLFSDRIFVRPGTSQYVVRVRDVASFSAAFHGASEAGISDLRVGGTFATFRTGGKHFEVEHLFAADFATRRSDASENLLTENA